MKLERLNDWGTIYYAPKGQGLTPSGFAEAKRGLELKEGPVKVTWPNGKQETLNLWARPYTDHVSDMGHSYDVTSKEYGFYADHYGVEVWIPVEAVEIELA